MNYLDVVDTHFTLWYAKRSKIIVYGILSHAIEKVLLSSKKFLHDILINYHILGHPENEKLLELRLFTIDHDYSKIH